MKFSSALYGTLLRVCPEDLRREFGDEMVLVFTDDLADSVARAGVRGAIAVWGGAVRELLCIGVRDAGCRTSVVAPLVSGVLSALSFPGEFIPSLVAAVASFAAVRT